MPYFSFLLLHIHLSSILRSYCVSTYDLTLWLHFFTYHSSPFLLFTVTKSHAVASSVCPFYHVSNVSFSFRYFFWLLLTSHSRSDSWSVLFISSLTTSYFLVHFLSGHVLYSLSLSYFYTVVIVSCGFGTFFSIWCLLLSCLILLFPFIGVGTIIISFLVLSRSVRLFSRIFSVALLRSVFRLSECILIICLMYSFVFSSTSRIRSCIFYIHYFFNRYIQFHFFHFLQLALYEISSCYIHSLLSSLFVAYIVLTCFFRLFPHFNFFPLCDILFLCVVLFRSSSSVYLVILSLLPVSFCLALLVRYLHFLFVYCLLRPTGWFGPGPGCYRSVQQGCWKLWGMLPLFPSSLRKSVTPATPAGQRSQSSSVGCSVMLCVSCAFMC